MTRKGKWIAVIGAALALVLGGWSWLSMRGNLDGKLIELSAPCRVGKVSAEVFASVEGQELRVELPPDLQGKFAAGERAWIGLVGTCRLEPLGGPMTAEQADGWIAVEKILFLDQDKGRKESLKILP